MTTTVRARGLVFDVVAGGRQDGPVVLLLHGFPQHSGEWDLVTPALHRADLRTYALDQRGYSPGARPVEVSAYAVGECVADALAVLDALGAAKAHVVGHDWGAIVAWHLAAQHPERLRTLTAISVPHPAAFIAALTEDADQRRRSAYITLLRRPYVAEEALLAAEGAWLRRAMRGVPEDRIERYVAPLRGPGALTGALNWYRAMDRDEMGRLGPVSVPTTYVWSERDGAVGRRAALGCPAYVTGDFRFVPLPGVSHWVPDEAPDAVVAAVLDRIGS
jgi:pimeloyl-ACP methyl ester carboxylesterase